MDLVQSSVNNARCTIILRCYTRQLHEHCCKKGTTLNHTSVTTGYV